MLRLGRFEFDCSMLTAKVRTRSSGPSAFIKMSSFGSCDQIIEFQKIVRFSSFGQYCPNFRTVQRRCTLDLIVYGSHKYSNNDYFSKNRANLIETGKVVFCHGFMAAQAICILTIIFISLNATVSETGPIMVEQRFNSTRLS